MRDSKKPTVVSVSYDKTGKNIVLTDLSGELGIVAKDDAEGLLELIKSIISNKDLPELSLAQVTIGKETTTSTNIDLTDLTNLKQQGLQLLLGQLQNISNYPRK